MTKICKREDIFSDSKETFLLSKMRQIFDTESRTEMPPFPRQIQFETTNICNHGCSFCAYTTMTRPKKTMNVDMFKRICKEAYDLGAREIGLFSGAEPLTCVHLPDFIQYAHSIGYEYSYISTNGTFGGKERLKMAMDAGLRSIKFSINGGTSDSYKKVHKHDNFETAIESVKFVADYRRTLKHPTYLSVSYVECPDSAGTFDNLSQLVGELVDEVLYYEADNQSGQLDSYSKPLFEHCPLPFNKAHISVEGYLRGCCNDYENMLAMEDLNSASLKDAWHSVRFESFRQRHISDQLEGTLCGRCIRGHRDAPEPLNPELSQARIPGCR